MRTDQDLLSEVANAFGDVPRPARFLPDVGDYEFDDHDELLQSRTVETISSSDLRWSWDPLASCCAQGVAYFFPAMAKIALEATDDPWDWYGEQMLFHLTYQGTENEFMRFCNLEQRAAVMHLIEHLLSTRTLFIEQYCLPEDSEECAQLWRASCT